MALRHTNAGSIPLDRYGTAWRNQQGCFLEAQRRLSKMLAATTSIMARWRVGSPDPGPQLSGDDEARPPP